MPPSITVPQLQERLARGEPLTILDVRRALVFAGTSDLIEGATWRDPEAVMEWAPELPRERPLVVYCVHGHAVSQGVADRLRGVGLDAHYLEGGIEGWREGGGRLQAK